MSFPDLLTCACGACQLQRLLGAVRRLFSESGGWWFSLRHSNVLRWMLITCYVTVTCRSVVSLVNWHLAWKFRTPVPLSSLILTGKFRVRSRSVPAYGSLEVGHGNMERCSRGTRVAWLVTWLHRKARNAVALQALVRWAARVTWRCSVSFQKV